MNVVLKPGGVVTLPAEVIEGLDLEPGNQIAFKRGPNGEYTLEKAPESSETSETGPAREEFRRRIRAAVGSAGPGPSTEELMALLRGED